MANAEEFKLLLTHSLIAEGLKVDRDWVADITDYNKPINLPDSLKAAIHEETGTDGRMRRYFDIKEAAYLLSAETLGNSEHPYQRYTECVMTEEGKKMMRDVEAYFRDGSRPSPDPTHPGQPVKFSTLHQRIMQFSAMCAENTPAEPVQQHTQIAAKETVNKGTTRSA